jgi:hypothetical protein
MLVEGGEAELLVFRRWEEFSPRGAGVQALVGNICVRRRKRRSPPAFLIANLEHLLYFQIGEIPALGGCIPARIASAR